MYIPESIQTKVIPLVDAMKTNFKHADHELKGQAILKKWVSVFLMFISWTILKFTAPNLANDILVILTVFGLAYGLVHVIFKPLIQKKKTVLYTDLQNEVQKHLELILEGFDTLDISSFQTNEALENSDYSLVSTIIIQERNHNKLVSPETLTKIIISKSLPVQYSELV